MFFLQMGWVCLKRVLEKSWPFLFALQGSQEVCCSPLRDESSTGQPPSQAHKERICTPDNQPCPATMTHDHTFPEADQTRHALSRLSFAPSNQQSFSPSKKKKKKTIKNKENKSAFFSSFTVSSLWVANNTASESMLFKRDTATRSYLVQVFF